MLVYLLLLARRLGATGATDWGRDFVLATACFGTLLTPFLVTLNNHTIAAHCVLFAFLAALRIWEDEAAPIWCHGIAGLFAGLAACFELPAAAFAAATFVVLLLKAPGRALGVALPALLLPVAALLYTNYLAIGELAPAYGKLDSPWYRYEGSHWRVEPGQVKRGIDFLDEPKSVYAFHLLFGHHGLFSLTPVLLLAIVGMAWGVICTFGRRTPLRGLPAWQVTAGLTLLVTVVVVGFYIANTNNYGGWTCGPRWLMWLTPLWLLTMLPVADWLAVSRIRRLVGYVLLGVSVLSMSYPAWNPWRHPWIYNWLESRGWISY